MDTVFETVTDAIVDAGDLVLDATLGDGQGGGGRRLRRAVLVLLLLGGVLGIVLWRRLQATEEEDVSATAAS